MKLYPSIIARLEIQHTTITEIILPVNEENLILNPAPGKWSIKDNIAHLAKYQLVFLERIDKIVNTGFPQFEPYNADTDVEFKKWQNKDLRLILDHLNNGRKRIINVIKELDDAGLEKCGLHPKFGRLNVAEWTEFFLLHEAHHLLTIFRLAHSAENKNYSL